MSHWDQRFMDLARHVATWSKDRSRQVGCVIVGPFHHEVRSLGYNGFARGVNDDVEERHQRPLKYKWTEHAERNAIYNAGRCGVALNGCTLYLPWYPCADCARAIIQAGIAVVVAIEPDWNDATFGADFAITRDMFAEAGVHVCFLPGEAPKQKVLATNVPCGDPSSLADDSPGVQLAHTDTSEIQLVDGPPAVVMKDSAGYPVKESRGPVIRDKVESPFQR